MSHFTIHNLESAPKQSKPLLETSLKSFGLLPNLHGVMAEAPAVLEGYQKLHELFQKTSFSPEEITVVWQTLNVEHECHYCVPAHTAIAHVMKIDPAITKALRTGSPLPEKLEALRQFTLAVTRKRGNVDQSDLDAFFGASYCQQQVLEVVLGLAQKVMSNYINHLAKTPLNEALEKYAWQKEEALGRVSKL